MIRLPKSFSHLSTKDSNIVYASIFNIADLQKWVKEYSVLNWTDWFMKIITSKKKREAIENLPEEKVLPGRRGPLNTNENALILCHRSEIKMRKLYKTKYSNKNCDCKARITFKIFKKKQSMFPTVINFKKMVHNHPLYDAETLGCLRPTEELRSKFIEYFERGLHTKTSLAYHKTILKRTLKDYHLRKTSSRIIPKFNSVSNWYTKWMKAKIAKNEVEQVQYKPRAKWRKNGELFKQRLIAKLNCEPITSFELEPDSDDETTYEIDLDRDGNPYCINENNKNITIDEYSNLIDGNIFIVDENNVKYYITNDATMENILGEDIKEGVLNNEKYFDDNGDAVNDDAGKRDDMHRLHRAQDICNKLMGMLMHPNVSDDCLDSLEKSLDDCKTTGQFAEFVRRTIK